MTSKPANKASVALPAVGGTVRLVEGIQWAYGVEVGCLLRDFEVGIVLAHRCRGEQHLLTVGFERIVIDGMCAHELTVTAAHSPEAA